MFNRSWIGMGLVSLGLLANLTSPNVLAGEHVHTHTHVKSTQPTPHTMEQAGYPLEVSAIAKEAYGPHYSGGYVGGGTYLPGNGRCVNAGTFGWDYTPFSPLSSRIFLNWSGHGHKTQGGFGAYKTDGPKPLEHIQETVRSHFGGEE